MRYTKISFAFLLVYIMHCLYSIFSFASTSILDKYVTKMLNLNHEELSYNFVSRWNDSDMSPLEEIRKMPIIRTKRQSSGGKYTDAAKMPQVKLLRLVLQMFRNSWADVYVGGAHPFHHEVPKPVIQLFKQKIIEFFFPDIGDEYKKKNK